MNGMKKMNKVTRNNLITYVMVIVLYIIVQALIMSGSLSSLMQGLLVPLCAYVILFQRLFLKMYGSGDPGCGSAVFYRPADRGGSGRNLRHPDRNPGAATERGLPSDRHSGLRRDH